MRDVDAQGADSESKREWQKKRGIDTSKQVRIVKLNHMRYQHPDLNKATTFLRGKDPISVEKPVVVEDKKNMLAFTILKAFHLRQ